MRTKVIMTICLFLLMAGKASAQWSVIDPTNIAQSIINSSNNIVHTSSTAQNMINNFKETVKIYEQGKKYYDALKSISMKRFMRCEGSSGSSACQAASCSSEMTTGSWSGSGKYR